MSLFRRGQSSPTTEAERRQKSEERAARSEVIRQARSAVKAMTRPEPQYGLYTSALLVILGLVSFLSKDVAQQYEKVHGKVKAVNVVVAPYHSQEAAILIVLAVAAAVTIYWRRRLVTGIAFMLAAAIGVGTPFPNGYSDLKWLAFLVPAAYVFWMLIFRMNKEQKAWLSRNSPAASASGAASTRNSGRRSGGTKPAASRSGRGKTQPATTASGRPLPTQSARYTPPRQAQAQTRQKTRAGGRKP